MVFGVTTEAIISKSVLMFTRHTELYTDESPGLKVDPVVVLVLSLGFIFSVVALHSESPDNYLIISF